MDVNTSLVCVSPSVPCDLPSDYRDDDENLCICQNHPNVLGQTYTVLDLNYLYKDTMCV